MTKTKEKIEELESTIKNYDAVIESLKIQLAETKKKDPHGSTKKFWLTTMQACTAPFAKYNKNLKSNLKNPDLYKLQKDTNKLQTYVLKIYSNLQSFNNEKKIVKSLLKLSKLEEKILANPSYISQSYDDSMNVKETLEETLNAKSFLSELLNQLKVPILPKLGLEKIADPA